MLYWDKFTGGDKTNMGAELIKMAESGATHILLAFWSMTKAQCAAAGGSGCTDVVDMAMLWERLGQEEQVRVMTALHANGCQLLVSCGGATENPISGSKLVGRAAAEAYGRDMAQWAIDNNLDGVDFDFEDGAAFVSANYTDFTGAEWLCAANNMVRTTWAESAPASGSPVVPLVPVVTHAPQAPYFMSNWKAYDALPNHVHGLCGDQIDFYNMQYYNQMATTYMTCYALTHEADGGDGAAPCTALMEVCAAGVPWHKLVVGKGMLPMDLTNTGYMAPDYLAWTVLHLTQAVGKLGGVMTWQWHSAEDEWDVAYGGISSSAQWVQLMRGALEGKAPTEFDFYKSDVLSMPQDICTADEDIPDSPGLKWKCQSYLPDPKGRCTPVTYGDPDTSVGIYSSLTECRCACGAGCGAEAHALYPDWKEQPVCAMPGRLCGGNQVPAGAAYEGVCCQGPVLGHETDTTTYECGDSQWYATCGPKAAPGEEKYQCNWTNYNAPVCEVVANGWATLEQCQQTCVVPGAAVLAGVPGATETQ